MTSEIRTIEENKERFLDLLLLADPSRELVLRYLEVGDLFALYDDSQVCGVLLLTPYETNSVEIKNIAVREDRQGRGYGKQLVKHAIEIARRQQADRIIVGTGNSGIGALVFYQKIGFRFWAIRRDFFTKHYSEPIFENGIQCRDMLMLEIDLSTKCTSWPEFHIQ
jgi:ribosomal protein S18 acetylase RimI-like enzyme